MMIARIMGVYVGFVVLLGGIVALDSLKKVRRKWEELPETIWPLHALFAGVLLLFISGLLELFIWKIYRSPQFMAISIGLIEESLKLTPALFLFGRLERSRLWKLTLGIAMVFAAFETISYISAFILASAQSGTQILLFSVRLIVIVFHVLWTVVPLSYLLYGKKREALAGWIFAVFAHAIYDYPVLAASAGEKETIILAGVFLSILFILYLKIAVGRALQIVVKKENHLLPALNLSCSS